MAVGSPVRAQSELRWVILGVSQQIQAAIVVGEPLCDLEVPFWALVTPLRFI